MTIVAKEKEIDPNFGPKLRALRERAGMSQDRLAELVGMSGNAIARIERAEREPGWGTVLKLANALGVTPDTFVKKSGE